MKPLHTKTTVVLVLILSVAGYFFANFNSLRATKQLAIAQLALKDRDVDKALIAARQAVQLDPLNGEAHFAMARALRRLAKWDQVRSSLDLAAKFGIPTDRIRCEQLIAMAQAGQLQEAVPHLKELLINPKDNGPEICEAYANGFFLMYRLTEAFAILDAWEKDYPQDPQPYVFRAAVSAKAENWTAAAKHLRRALELAPNRIDVQIELAKNLLVLQEIEESEKMFSHLRTIQPGHPEVLVGSAQVLIELGRPEEARPILDSALLIKPRHDVALRLRGELHSSAGQSTEAIKLLEEAVSLNANNRQARYALGTALKKAGRDTEARQHFQFVAKNAEVGAQIEQLVVNVRKNNGDVDSRFKIAQLHRETGDQWERLMWLRSVIFIDANHKDAHAELAKCYAELGNLEESNKHSRLADIK